MIAYVLACVMWSKPELKNFEVPLNDYAMAFMNIDFKDHVFEADVIEERMNSVRITSKISQASTMSYSTRDYALKALTVRFSEKDSEASLDCEVRPQQKK